MTSVLDYVKSFVILFLMFYISLISMLPDKLNIQCDPASEITFEGDFRTASVVELTVKNRSKTAVLFKLKTTTPHR